MILRYLLNADLIIAHTAVLILCVILISCTGVGDYDTDSPKVDNDCSSSDLLHSYDLEIHHRYVKNGVESTPGVSNHQKSGFDYRSVVKSEDGSETEVIVIEGKPGAFNFDGENWSTFSEIVAMGTDYILTEYSFPYVLDTLCPDVDDWNNKGREFIDQVAVTRYSNSSSDWEYLIDDNGKLVQAETTRHTPYEDLMEKIQVKFSGFGEPNTIVDPFPHVMPVYTSTPGPSPTPDPSATVAPQPTATVASTATPTSIPTSTPGTLPPLFPTDVPVVIPTPTPLVALADIVLPSPTPTPGIISTPTPTHTPTVTPSPTNTPTVTPTATPVPRPLISRIEPYIRSATMGIGDTAQLSVAVYGLQNIRDDSLGSNVTFDWSVTSAGGSFREVDPGADSDSVPDERKVYFEASKYGNYTVTASLDRWECIGGCSARFNIRIRR